MIYKKVMLNGKCEYQTTEGNEHNLMKALDYDGRFVHEYWTTDVIEGAETRVIIDVPERTDVDETGSEFIVEAVTHLEYLHPANYTIELEDDTSDAYKIAHYADFRRKEYPSIDDMIVALWEKLIENRDAAATEIQTKRSEVKLKYPKA